MIRFFARLVVSAVGWVALAAAAFALSCAPDAPPTAPAMPAAKVNESWGFDFRIRLAPGLPEQVPIDHILQIRKAAQAWERVIWDIGDLQHIEMPSQGFGLTVADDWSFDVLFPETYLGWSDMEILVYVDERIVTAEWAEGQIMARTGFYSTSPDRYLPIVTFGIAPATLEEMVNGTLSSREFYYVALHELGHALGIGTSFLQRLGKVRQTATACAYIDTNGVAAFAAMKGYAYQSIPMEADCSHWDMMHVRWSGVFDVMFTRWVFWDIPNGNNLISLASLGVLEDLGFWVDYAEADDTRIAWRDDPRRHVVAKPVAGSRWHCAPPTVMPAEAVVWID